jgi:outer membrane protein
MKIGAVLRALTSVLICWPGFAQTGAPIPLTTYDVIQLVLDNNRDLTVTRGGTLSSRFLVGSFQRPFQPNFHVVGTFDHATSPSSNLLAGAASLVELTHEYTIGIDQAFQTGTAYTVDFQLGRSSSNSVFNVYNPAYRGTIRYQVAQHLLRDFGRRVNSRQIRIAQNNEKISELDFELEVIKQVRQALESYWDIVFAGEDLRVKQRSLELASKTLRDNQIQAEVGTRARIDLVQAEAEVATRYMDFVTAQYEGDRLQDEMKKIISNDNDPGLVLTRLNLIEPVHQPGVEVLLPLNQAIQFALENRPEIRQSRYDADNQEINLIYAKNQLRPSLDIAAGYSHSGLGGTKTLRSSLGQGGEVLQVIPGGPGEMFGQLFSFTYPNYSAGFTFEIPLRNPAGKAEYARAVNERNVSVSRKAAVAQRIALEVRNAFTQLDMNRALVATARKTRELSRLRLDAEQTKFDLGASTIRFVLEEQRNLAQAETDEIKALVGYTKALVGYDQAIGNTLARNNIDIGKQLRN